jgi:hypothetical protein
MRVSLRQSSNLGLTGVLRSIVENNVAIIVSCMPGLASFVKVQVKESSLYLSFQSGLSRTKNSSLSASKGGASHRKLHERSLDSGLRRQQDGYLELEEWGSGSRGVSNPAISKDTGHITKSPQIE